VFFIYKYYTYLRSIFLQTLNFYSILIIKTGFDLTNEAFDFLEKIFVAFDVDRVSPSLTPF